MKKIFYLALFSALLWQTNLQAQEPNTDEIKIPMEYLNIDQKCFNTDINLYNICLKEAFLNIIEQNFTSEQQVELKNQIADIETQVAEAEPDYDNPVNQGLKDNPAKIKEFNAKNMNLIWKKLLVDTINSLNDASLEEI